MRIILARNKVKKLHSLAQEAARIDSCADALFLEVEDLQRNIVAADSNFPLIDIDITEPLKGLDDDETWVNQTARAAELLPATDALSDVAMTSSFTLLLSSSGRLCSIGKNPVLVKEGPNSRWQLPLKSRISQLSCGDAHAAMLTERGNVLVCGSGQRGQLGRGHFENGSLVAEVPGLESHVGFRQVRCASFGTVALTNDGTVYTWGMGTVLGRGVYLGDGDSATPMKVQSIAAFRIREVACGKDFVVSLTYQGSVYAWGANDFGEMGPGAQLGRPKYLPSEVRMEELSPTDPIQSVCCGLKHVAALTASGGVLCWGRSDTGQTSSNPNSLNSNGVNRSFPGKNADTQQPRIATIACGGRQTYAIGTDGAVYGWGVLNACKLSSSPSSITVEPVRLSDKCLGSRPRNGLQAYPPLLSQRLSTTFSRKGSATFYGLAEARSRKQPSTNPHVVQLSEATAIDPEVCSMLLLARKPTSEASASSQFPGSPRQSRSSRNPRNIGPSVERKTESEILAERVASFQNLHAIKDSSCPKGSCNARYHDCSQKAT